MSEDPSLTRDGDRMYCGFAVHNVAFVAVRDAEVCNLPVETDLQCLPAPSILQVAFLVCAFLMTSLRDKS